MPKDIRHGVAGSLLGRAAKSSPEARIETAYPAVKRTDTTSPRGTRCCRAKVTAFGRAFTDRQSSVAASRSTRLRPSVKSTAASTDCEVGGNPWQSPRASTSPYFTGADGWPSYKLRHMRPVISRSEWEPRSRRRAARRVQPCVPGLFAPRTEEVPGHLTIATTSPGSSPFVCGSRPGASPRQQDNISTIRRASYGHYVSACSPCLGRIRRETPTGALSQIPRETVNTQCWSPPRVLHTVP